MRTGRDAAAAGWVPRCRWRVMAGGEVLGVRPDEQAPAGLLPVAALLRWA